MYDLERITSMMKDIDKYFLKLKEVGLNSENVHNSEKFYASSMLMFSILNRMIDLASEILVKNDFGMPSAYEQYFEVLASNGIIDRKIEKDLKQLVKDRNLFAHQYFSINEKEVLNVSRRIQVVKDFVERIKKVVEKSERLKRAGGK
jgi:uncharacterized protein YutE (UPF0331/DUF86 family)